MDDITSKLNSIAEMIRKTLTDDWRKEMARHKERAALTGMQTDICSQYSP